MPHYFDSEPAVASRRRLVKLELGDVAFELETDRGVFSWSAVDPGTALLLSTIPRPPGSGEVLDLGCGYGPIALTVAARSPRARVWAVDVNQRALELTRSNASRAGLDNVVAARPDDVPAALTFEAMYSNPPVRVGKASLHQLLSGWLERLTPDGHAYLVVQRHLGSDSLASWLREHGHAVERLRSRSAYRVLDVRHDSHRATVKAMSLSEDRTGDASEQGKATGARGHSRGSAAASPARMERA